MLQNDLTDHADAAVSAAMLIQRLVAERFEGALRIGIGIHTGTVIAGTIGGAILLTQQTVDALASGPPGLTDRGSHALKGKSAAIRVFGLNPAV